MTIAPMLRSIQHQLAMAGMQRRFAKQQHQPPTFLQRDIGGAREQIVVRAVGDRGKRPNRAGRDNHAVRWKRAARNRGSKISNRIDLCVASFSTSPME